MLEDDIMTAIENDRVPLEYIRMTLKYVSNNAEIAMTYAIDEVTEKHSAKPQETIIISHMPCSIYA
ncbi:MAG: hypothetical protein M3114_03610 [Thermoproteota archaeon]|jgi:hypothetical protein|nr:hypothetical protein [Thermoproteota archaeon]MDQ3969964.1 hypothetical protein [Thermoproteota archaeon]MDQ4066655.1 hypothetical protein [Thermoproteota archaeon]